MYNTIIVATDFSNEASTIQSLKKAVKLADNGHIYLLHVVEDIPTYALADLVYDLNIDQTPHAQKILNKLKDESRVEVELEIRKGGSYQEIIQSIKEHNSDLVIINSHRPGLKDYLLGSTASKVVRHAPCSVLIER